MWQVIKRMYHVILDLVFPPFCAQCRNLGSFLCERCYDDIEFSSFEPKLKLEEIHLDRVLTLSSYSGPIKSLMFLMKYQNVRAVATYCGHLIYQHLFLPEVDVMTFVPIHRWRQVERGFNQAEEIARELSRRTSVLTVKLLTKHRHTPPQASLFQREKRLQNLNNVFQYIGAVPPPAKVLLIDDVMTTGTTMNECARVLKAAGVKTVIGLAVAHGY